MTTLAPAKPLRSIVGTVVTVPMVSTTRRGTVMRFALRDGTITHQVIARGPHYWGFSQTRVGDSLRVSGAPARSPLGGRRFHATRASAA